MKHFYPVSHAYTYTRTKKLAHLDLMISDTENELSLIKSPVSILNDLEMLNSKNCPFTARQKQLFPASHGTLTDHNIHALSTVPDFIKIRILK